MPQHMRIAQRDIPVYASENTSPLFFATAHETHRALERLKVIKIIFRKFNFPRDGHGWRVLGTGVITKEHGRNEKSTSPVAVLRPVGNRSGTSESLVNERKSVQGNGSCILWLAMIDVVKRIADSFRYRTNMPWTSSSANSS